MIRPQANSGVRERRGSEQYTVNTILEASARMPFHTDLRAVFRAIGDRQREFDWLLTDYDLTMYPHNTQNVGQG